MKKLQATPVWKDSGEPNRYRQNELYRRFRSMCYELSQKSVSVEDPDFENRVVEDFARLQRKYNSK